VTFTLQSGANGILPDRMIAAMADAGLILPAYPFIESQIQPASLDLRLGDVAYRVRASFLPGPGATVAERIDQLKLHEIDLTDGAVLIEHRSITGHDDKITRPSAEAVTLFWRFMIEKFGIEPTRTPPTERA